MTISGYLEEDHRRIETFLQQATGSRDQIEPKFYEEFRGALLRHIGMEERILFPAIRNATGGDGPQALEQLHRDHGALAALLVPTPNASILRAIHTILRRHNSIEEGPEGVYHRFEDLQAANADSLLTKLQTTPPVAMNPHVDNATAIESMQAAVQRAGYSLDL
jgi:hemerythrin superfamily protein